MKLWIMVEDDTQAFLPRPVKVTPPCESYPSL